MSALRNGGLAWVLAVAWAAVAVAAEPADVLWRAPSPSPCRLQLTHEQGGVEVRGLASGETARVLGSGGVGILATNGDDGRTVLTSEGRDSSQAGGDLIFEVPAGCDVAVSTAGGPVRVGLAPDFGPLAVATVTGDVTLEVDPGGDFDVALATSGEITVDFSVAIDYRYHSEPAKHGRVLIGSGKTNVRLTSRRGVVSVLRAGVPSAR